MNVLNDSVLIVDDEPMIVMGLTGQLEEMGMAICGSAASAEDAIRLAELHRPALVLMDMRLEGELDGVDATIVIHERVGSKVIFVTASIETTTLKRIASVNPFAVLTKPVSGQRLRAAVDAALAA